MIPLILTAAEARAARDGTLTEIRRPFVEANDSVSKAYRARVGGPCESAAAVFPDGSGTGWIASWGRGPFSAEETAREYPSGGFPCPFGAPGDVLWGKEAFHWPPWGKEAFHWPPWENDRDDVIYKADWPDPAAKLAEIQEYSEGTACWTTASKMPKWASRFAFRNRGVHVERVGDVWTWVVAVERLNRPNGAPIPPTEVR